MTRILVATLLASLTLHAQDRPAATPAPDGPDPWFGTFSIIAVDPATGEFGVGVQSRAFGAGAAVPYAKPAWAPWPPGCGQPALRAKAMALLEQGLTPAEVVKRITDEDPAVTAARSRSSMRTAARPSTPASASSTATTTRRIPVHSGGFAGHVTGVNFSAQGNTLASEEVVKAMAAAYQNGTGAMAERLMDALDAGQSKGGDTRGMQSAGILVCGDRASESDSTVRAGGRHPRRRPRAALQGTAPPAST